VEQGSAHVSKRQAVMCEHPCFAPNPQQGTRGPVPPERTVVVRNRANQASGLMIQAVLAGYVVVGDPLRLTTAHDLTLAPEERVMSAPWVWTPARPIPSW